MSKNELVIRIKVQPRSSCSGISGPYGDGLKVNLKSPPIEGKANKELVSILAKVFGIRKEDVEIVSGKSSKSKVVRLKGIRDVQHRLSRFLK